MVIPTQFKLHGHTITVIYVPDLMYKNNAYGFAKYGENLIELQPSTNEVPVPREIVEETFCHELTHHILDHMTTKYKELLRSDEDFVEEFGKLLHQALTTQQGYLQYDSTGENLPRSGEHVTDRS